MTKVSISLCETTSYTKTEWGIGNASAEISTEELYKLFSLLSRFGIILIYFYLCDR